MDRTRIAAKLTEAIGQVRADMQAVATDDVKQARLAVLEGYLDSFEADLLADLQTLSTVEEGFYHVKDADTYLGWFFRCNIKRQHGDTRTTFIRLVGRKL